MTLMPEIHDALVGAIKGRRTIDRRPRRRSRRVGLLAFGGIALAGSALVGSASNAGQPPTAAAIRQQLYAKMAAESVVTPPITTVDPDQAAVFSVLRASGPAMPASIRALMTHSNAAASYGVNVALARQLGSGHDAWVVPGKNGICLSLTDPVDVAAWDAPRQPKPQRET